MLNCIRNLIQFFVPVQIVGRNYEMNPTNHKSWLSIQLRHLMRCVHKRGQFWNWKTTYNNNSYVLTLDLLHSSLLSLTGFLQIILSYKVVKSSFDFILDTSLMTKKKELIRITRFEKVNSYFSYSEQIHCKEQKVETVERVAAHHELTIWLEIKQWSQLFTNKRLQLLTVSTYLQLNKKPKGK